MKLMLYGKEVSGMGHYVMAGDIKDATAEDSNVLSGKTYYNNNGKREGTMPNRGGMSAELAAGGSVSIPEGYHDGTGSVRAQDLASQTPGTAAAANIEAGYTAWVNGEMVEGSLAPFSPTGGKMVATADITTTSNLKTTFAYTIDPNKLYLITGGYFTTGATSKSSGYLYGLYFKGVTDTTLYDGGTASLKAIEVSNNKIVITTSRTNSKRYELWEIG